jgi:hypothetical protein
VTPESSGRVSSDLRTVGGPDWKDYKPARRDYWLTKAVDLVTALMSEETRSLVRDGAKDAIAERVGKDVEAAKIDSQWLFAQTNRFPICRACDEYPNPGGHTCTKEAPRV